MFNLCYTLYEVYMRGKVENLTGKKFGRLTVIIRTKSKNKRAMWLCKCNCGNEKIVSSADLLKGCVKSCGCLAKEIRQKGQPKHNLYHTRIYKIWSSMKNRCYLKSHIAYKNYGGRGIKVCDEWKNDVVEFYNWAINNGYKDNLSIDRINNELNYCPENCRWATSLQQQNNTRNNLKYVYNGEILTLAEISRKYNINYSTLFNRIKKNPDIKLAIEKPIDKSKSRF